MPLTYTLTECMLQEPCKMSRHAHSRRHLMVQPVQLALYSGHDARAQLRHWAWILQAFGHAQLNQTLMHC